MLGEKEKGLLWGIQEAEGRVPRGSWVSGFGSKTLNSLFSNFEPQYSQILALDSDLLSYERRVSDLDAQIQNLSVDNANLVHSRQLVVDRYTELKRTALELEMFRQSIVKMVKDPSSNPGGLVSSVLDDKSFDLNNANHLIMSPGKAATSPQSRNLHTQHYQQQPQLQQQLQQQQHQNHLQSINNPSFHHHRTSEGFSMYLDDDDDKSMMLKSIDLVNSYFEKSILIHF